MLALLPMKVKCIGWLASEQSTFARLTLQLNREKQWGEVLATVVDPHNDVAKWCSETNELS